jgi:hypothetical protein
MTNEEMKHYSAALDEIWWLRQALAYEAQVIEAQALDIPRLAKGRREILERRVESMKQAARGEVIQAYADRKSFSLRNAMKLAGAPETLTRHQWENRD